MPDNDRDTVIASFVADSRLQALDKYLQAGRYFEAASDEELDSHWSEAISHMRAGHFGTQLVRTITGVIGELASRGREVSDAAMADMNAAAGEAFDSFDLETKVRLIAGLAQNLAASRPNTPEN